MSAAATPMVVLGTSGSGAVLRRPSFITPDPKLGIGNGDGWTHCCHLIDKITTGEARKTKRRIMLVTSGFVCQIDAARKPFGNRPVKRYVKLEDIERVQWDKREGTVLLVVNREASDALDWEFRWVQDPRNSHSSPDEVLSILSDARQLYCPDAPPLPIDHRIHLMPRLKHPDRGLSPERATKQQFKREKEQQPMRRSRSIERLESSLRRENSASTRGASPSPSVRFADRAEAGGAPAAAQSPQAAAPAPPGVACVESESESDGDDAPPPGVPKALGLSVFHHYLRDAEGSPLRRRDGSPSSVAGGTAATPAQSARREETPTSSSPAPASGSPSRLPSWPEALFGGGGGSATSGGGAGAGGR